MRLVRNRIRCKHCGDVIESKSRHDRVTCRCGRCSADGGHDYLIRSYPESREDFEELSVIENDDYDE